MADQFIRAKWRRDPKLQRLLAVLNAEGEARIAGGAVRNTLLKKPVADIDIATTLVPERVMEICKRAGLGVHPTGIAHGTLTITVDKHPFEVTTLRRDVETDGRHAVVSFTTDWRTDAERRDFTINAMYCDARGKTYDFTEGCKDIRNQKVKFVGAPSSRIKEDALRILRFFRFHAQYGKGKLDAAGLAACTRSRKLLRNLSAERIRAEMLKLLVATLAVPTLKVMAKSGVLDEILPYTDDWRVIERLPTDPILRLFALSQSPLTLKERFKLSNAESKRIEALVEAPMVSPDLTSHEQRRMLYHLGPDLWRDAATLSFAQSGAVKTDRKWKKLIAYANKAEVPVFPLKGGDLIKAGIPSGPALGEKLARLEDWWIASDFKPTHQELLVRLEKIK
jgi:poly(A) polymerase